MNQIAQKVLSNEELLEKTHTLVKEERHLGLEVIKHLQEIFRRKLYLARGYSSPFEMCMKEFKYSEPAAQRRIDAMRLMNQLPEVEEKIKDGKISLSVAARVQTFLKQEQKRKMDLRPQQGLKTQDNLMGFADSFLDPSLNQVHLDHGSTAGPKEMTKEEKLELIHTIEGKSCREVEKELIRRNPEVKISPDRVKPVAPEKFEMKVTISRELFEKLEKVKGLLSHKAGYEWAEVFNEMAEIVVKKLEPTERPVKALKPPKGKMKHTHSEKKASSIRQAQGSKVSAGTMLRTRTRYIRKSVKAQVWKRDRGCCSYVDPQTLRRCESKSYLQMDHLQAFSLGGESTPENLRLLCGAHNRNRNERSYLVGSRSH